MSFIFKKNTINFNLQCEIMGANPVIFNVMVKNIKRVNPTANVEQIKKAILKNYEFCESHKSTLDVVLILFRLTDYRGG